MIKNEISKKGAKLSLAKKLLPHLTNESQQTRIAPDSNHRSLENTIEHVKQEADEKEESMSSFSSEDSEQQRPINTTAKISTALLNESLNVKKLSPSNKYNIYEFSLVGLNEKSILVTKDDVDNSNSHAHTLTQRTSRTNNQHLNLSLNNNLLALPEIQHLSRQYKRDTLDKQEQLKQMDHASNVSSHANVFVMLPPGATNTSKSKYLLTKRLSQVNNSSPHTRSPTSKLLSTPPPNEQENTLIKQDEHSNGNSTKSSPQRLVAKIKPYPSSQVSNVNEKLYLDIFIPS